MVTLAAKLISNLQHFTAKRDLAMFIFIMSKVGQTMEHGPELAPTNHPPDWMRAALGGTQPLLTRYVGTFSVL